MLQLCRQHGIHTAVDTCGTAAEEVFERIAPLTDLFLYDLKLMDPVKLKKYTSADAAVVLSNLEYLLNRGATVTIRIPLIPGITSTPENLGRIADFLGGFHPLPEVNLLPYHRTAEGKYEKLSMENKMKGTGEITGEEIGKSYEVFKLSGFQVKLG
jgi:pyruvate formate lyase activating enzyme